MKVVDFNSSSDDDGEPAGARPQRNGAQKGGDAAVPDAAGAARIAAQRRRLPMFRGRQQVVRGVLAQQVTVVLGETGSGKSTQLPQLLLAANPRERIVVTQPRRVAAVALARRVAAEAGGPVGATVGFQVRFQAQLSRSTAIRYVTDGMLMREFMLDPLLRKYSTVIVDEAHERTVTTDLLLGLLYQLSKRRPTLRIVIMSATLDAERFSEFFDGARVLFVEGKTFPVERFYLRAPIDNVVAGVVAAVLQLNQTEPTGDILAFLPGQEDIDAAVEQLEAAAPLQPRTAPRLWPLPLYAALPEHRQERVFHETPPNTRKIVLATNIAETSLTVSGVRYVIDSGLRKVRIFRSKLGLDSLLPAPVSQAAAAQRLGRAGREAPGKCFRLYTEQTYQEMAPHTEPEINRVAVATPVLLLKTAGVDDVLTFRWLEPPKPRAIAQALLQLYSLKALDADGKVTALGREMAVLPVEPQLAAVLIAAKRHPERGVRDAVIDIAACLSVQDLLVTPPVARRAEVNDARTEQFPAAQQHGDLWFIKQVYDAYRALPRSDVKAWCAALSVNPRALRSVELVRRQLRKYLQISDAADDDEQSSVAAEDIVRTFLRGFAANTAVGLPDRRYQTTVTNQPLSIHPSSALFGRRVPAILYLEYIFTNKGYARMVSPIELEWLREAAPQLVGEK